MTPNQIHKKFDELNTMFRLIIGDNQSIELMKVIGEARGIIKKFDGLIGAVCFS